MSTLGSDEVPQHLVASYATGFGAEGRAWISGLPALAADMLDRWQLERDGTARAGEASLVLPVLRPDGTPAVLRLQMPRQETAAALIGLRAWDGTGMVRLLDHDPVSSSMLLERLDGARTLASINDDDVAMTALAEPTRGWSRSPRRRDCAAWATLLPRCWRRSHGRSRGWPSRPTVDSCGTGHRRWPNWSMSPGTGCCTGICTTATFSLPSASRGSPSIPNHSPADPGFDLWPALDSRWDDVVVKGDAPRIVRRRFDLLTDVLGLDRARATGWTLGRLLQNSLWDIEDGETRLAPPSVTIAESLLDRGSMPAPHR